MGLGCVLDIRMILGCVLDIRMILGCVLDIRMILIPESFFTFKAQIRRWDSQKTYRWDGFLHFFPDLNSLCSCLQFYIAKLMLARLIVRPVSRGKFTGWATRSGRFDFVKKGVLLLSLYHIRICLGSSSPIGSGLSCLKSKLAPKMKLTSHFHLLLRFKMHGAVPPFPYGTS